MKEIEHHEFSLFLLEKGLGQNDLVQKCFEYVNTFTSLEEAREYQKNINFKTLIIPTY
jgi:hypothetical protein